MTIKKKIKSKNKRYFTVRFIRVNGNHCHECKLFLEQDNLVCNQCSIMSEVMVPENYIMGK